MRPEPYRNRPVNPQGYSIERFYCFFNQGQGGTVASVTKTLARVQSRNTLETRVIRWLKQRYPQVKAGR
jgi:hypothetical protein